MNPLLHQFIHEARDFLQGIGEKLIALETQPDSDELMTELFRLVHTLKGNSGLFDFPEMTRVLHAGEDLMDAVRDGRVGFSCDLADRLLEAMDFVGALLDEIEKSGVIRVANVAPSEVLARNLRIIIPTKEPSAAPDTPALAEVHIQLPALTEIPEPVRIDAWRSAAAGTTLFLVGYRPDDECFFKGEDPFHQARQMPGLLWGTLGARAPWPKVAELDCYRCQLNFYMLVACERSTIEEYFRYTPEQVRIQPVEPFALLVPTGTINGGPVYGDFVAEALLLLNASDLQGLEIAARALLELSSPDLWLASALRWLLVLIEVAPEQHEAMRRLLESLNHMVPPQWCGLCLSAGADTPVSDLATGSTPRPIASAQDRARIAEIVAVQADILACTEDGGAWPAGRAVAAAKTLRACMVALGDAPEEIDAACAAALELKAVAPLLEWLQAWCEDHDLWLPGPPPLEAAPSAIAAQALEVAAAPPPSASRVAGTELRAAEGTAATPVATAAAEGDARFGRRAEDAQAGKVLKVDQSKVDRLMNLIGEMVVAKNALPYLASRAETNFGVRELAREIKGQYAVINRIAEDMQDAIMQVRMMPVSFIFQRFPRLVRDISNKLGKEVELVLQGEDTEADKSIIESLADPLIHIVRNSLDHGLEMPQVRLAAGKSRTGRIRISAQQESDHVVIEISDDGKGIDPVAVKRKAYQKGLIDETQLERISDQDAVNLVFAAGFSMATEVSDLSGRGVGMDVVRNAINKVNGSVDLASTLGKGTTLRLTLPLSMAVSNVMIIESDRQIFGVPMDMVVETVRVPSNVITTIKRQKTTVLRDRILPLVALNDLLAVAAQPMVNGDGELAVLVVRVGSEQVGLLVDEFCEVVDVILKPLPGELSKLKVYAGSALLGDGTVLMVLNPKELF